LGSRFWALVEEGSDSDEVVVTRSEQFLGRARVALTDPFRHRGRWEIFWAMIGRW
jgi:hypothetical protein